MCELFVWHVWESTSKSGVNSFKVECVCESVSFLIKHVFGRV